VVRRLFRALSIFSILDELTANFLAWLISKLIYEQTNKRWRATPESIRRHINHMQLEEGIEVMRAHRARLKHNPSTSDTPKPRPSLSPAVPRQSLHPQECCGQTEEQQVQGIFYFYI